MALDVWLTRGDAKVRLGERLSEHSVCEPLDNKLQCLLMALERREHARNGLLRSPILLGPKVYPAGHNAMRCKGAETQNLVIDIIQRRDDGTQRVQ